MEATLTSTTHPTEFRHTPEAPAVHPSHPRQRYFIQRGAYDDALNSLMRMDTSDRATLYLQSDQYGDDGELAATSEMRVHLSADDLLVLARACVDAAHDLRANPAPVREAA